MKYLVYIVAIMGFLVGCQEEEPELDTLLVPTNLAINAVVSEDGSGRVVFEVNAENAIVYHFLFGNSSTETPFVSYDGSAENFYKKSGTNDYNLQVIAFGKGGVSSNATQEVTVFVDFKLPVEVISALTNNSSKQWYWKKSIPGHLGVGPPMDDDGNAVSEPLWYQATAFEKESDGCLYDDILTFSSTPSGEITFTNMNNDVTYFHTDEILDALGIPSTGSDACFDFVLDETPGAVQFGPINSGVTPSTGIQMDLENGAFMSYFLNSSSYEIMSITPEELRVRTVQDVNGSGLAWYHTFSNSETAKELELVWSDEFDIEGAPNPEYWAYDLGTGSNGWGNGESQYYTDRTENISVSGGILKITAQREDFEGSTFTSSRLKTQNLFDFTYGTIEFRAKLPEGGGTWPALWMLGSNFETVGWPTCGEIDVMEHVGNQQDKLFATLHYPLNAGGGGVSGSTEVPGISEEFHVFSCVWSADKIEFFVDDVMFHSFNNSADLPFNADFFIIMNVAMGGNFGGEIDGNFQSSSLEIDYVRVYQ